MSPGVKNVRMSEVAQEGRRGVGNGIYRMGLVWLGLGQKRQESDKVDTSRICFALGMNLNRPELRELPESGVILPRWLLPQMRPGMRS